MSVRVLHNLKLEQAEKSATAVFLQQNKNSVLVKPSQLVQSESLLLTTAHKCTTSSSSSCNTQLQIELGFGTRATTALFFLKTNSSYFAFQRKRAGKVQKRRKHGLYAVLPLFRALTTKNKNSNTRLCVYASALCCKHKSHQRSEDEMKTDRRFVLKLLLVRSCWFAHTRQRARASSAREKAKRSGRRGLFALETEAQRGLKPRSAFFEQKKTFLCSFSPAPLFSVIFFFNRSPFRRSQCVFATFQRLPFEKLLNFGFFCAATCFLVICPRWFTLKRSSLEDS